MILMSQILSFQKLMNSELPEAENIKNMLDSGIDEITANFICDLETGAVDGDAVNEDGVDIYKDSKGLYVRN